MATVELDFGLNFDLTSVSSQPDFVLGMHPTVELAVTVAGGQGALTKGTPLAKKTADGKYYKYNESANDGTQTLAGPLGIDVAESSDDTNAFIYVHGDFWMNLAKFQITGMIGGYATIMNLPAGAYNNGSIVIKEGVK